MGQSCLDVEACLHKVRLTIFWVFLVFGGTTWCTMSPGAQSGSPLEPSPRDCPSLTDSEKAELARRRNALLFALLRTPFFEKFITDAFLTRMWGKIPMLGSLNIVPLLLLWRRYYFCTSGT